LPTGKVLFWDRRDVWDGCPRLWGPATGRITAAASLADHDVFCAGHTFLPDGRLLVAGGQGLDDTVGQKSASIYDPFTDTWAPAPDMNAGRWYPTTTTLANGDVLVLSGEVDGRPGGAGRNVLPQVFEPATGAWRDLTSAQ